jgi:HAD superfamily hydrolase (TIGR01490 family)
MAPAQRVKRNLTLFDLDHTLLSGDSDVLWCEFLMDQGLLAREAFAARNADMAARYRAGSVGMQEFTDFYVGTLARKSPAQWDPLRREFLATQVIPRIPGAAAQLVKQHLGAGDLVLLTTATNRFITELTARHFAIEHLLATEPELVDGVFTCRACGTLNMRQGKVARLNEWLAARGQALDAFHSKAYSDSINDLPLLEAVNEPCCVDPDRRLALVAQERGWPVLRIHP